MLAVAMLATKPSRDAVRRVRESNVLHDQSKGKTQKGAEDSGIVQSNGEMFYLLRIASPNLQFGAAPEPPCRRRECARTCRGGQGETAVTCASSHRSCRSL